MCFIFFNLKAAGDGGMGSYSQEISGNELIIKQVTKNCCPAQKEFSTNA